MIHLFVSLSIAIEIGFAGSRPCQWPNDLVLDQAECVYFDVLCETLAFRCDDCQKEAGPANLASLRGMRDKDPGLQAEDPADTLGAYARGQD